MKPIQRTTAFLTACLAGLAPLAVLAQTSLIQGGLDKAASGPYGPAKKPQDLPVLVGNFIGIAFDLFGILLMVYLLWGGYNWLTAGGDQKKVETAIAIIKNAIIGIVILVTANFIAGYVLAQLAAATSASG